MTITAFALRHIGGAGPRFGPRENQEDEFVCRYDERFGLFAAIDGMGGTACGEEAARITREILDDLDITQLDVVTLEDALCQADRETLIYGDIYSLRSIGSVATVAWVNLDQECLIVTHVGDARAYILRNGMFWPLTIDHTPSFMHSIDMTDAKRMRTRGNCIIEQSLGQGRALPDSSFRKLRGKPYSLLLCSDGLHDALHPEIAGMIMQGLHEARSGQEVHAELRRIAKLHQELKIEGEADDELGGDLLGILLRGRLGHRTCKQVAQDLLEATLLCQPHIKGDNICIIVAHVLP